MVLYSNSFTPCHIRDIQAKSTDCQLVKLFVRYKGLTETNPPLMVFDDGDSSVLVDYSFVESISCENGEWYRILCTNEINNGSVLTLNLPPLWVTDFDPGIHSEMLDVREDFMLSFDSLLAYACKHK